MHAFVPHRDSVSPHRVEVLTQTCVDCRHRALTPLDVRETRVVDTLVVSLATFHKVSEGTPRTDTRNLQSVAY